MKLTPVNQSLILAGESTRPGGATGFQLDDALRAVTSGATLKQVTIVAARPDSMVVMLRADYASSPDAALVAARPATARLISSDAAGDEGDGGASERDAQGNSRTRSGAMRTASYLSPVEQYARTQRSLDEAPATAHIDVHA